MTLSLSSSFDFSPRRAACLIADKLFVYHWENKGLTKALMFDANDAGVNAFSHYLSNSDKWQTYFMVDLIEEEFRIDSVPHVLGPDKRALFERKLERYFRGTSFRHSEIQGRDQLGRKDDIALFSALTRPDAITPWLEALERAKVPVVGLYSRALLAPTVLKKSGLPLDNCLLVTLHNPSGLRQTYVKNGKVKLSRLAKLPRKGTIPYGPFLLDEIEKVHQYLKNQRLLKSDENLRAVIITNNSLIEELKKLPARSEQISFLLADSHSLAVKSGMKKAKGSLYADALFAHVLLETKPQNIYATKNEKRYYNLHRLRKGLFASAISVFLGSAIWSSFTLVEGVSLKQEQVTAQRKADFYQARYRLAKEGLPDTPVEPYELETAVNLVHELAERKATPAPIMDVISDSLVRFADLQIDMLDWQVSHDPNKGFELKATADNAQPNSFIDQDEKYLYYQVAKLRGYVSPFDGNYRKALDAINFFAEALRSNDKVVHVAIHQLPLDISSTASLEGNVVDKGGLDSKQTGFAMRIVLGVLRAK